MPSKVTRTDPLPSGSFKTSPLERVRELFAGFVQGLFHAAPPGAYHWEPSADTTEIFISDESPVHVDTLGVRPAVSFTRGPVSFYSLGLDDMLSYSFETGGKQKSVLVPGTMSINCVSRAALESERLAWIIAEQLWLHRELLMREGFFEVGRQPVIGAPSPAGSLVQNDSADEYVVTTVSCPFQFYRTSSAAPIGKKIVNSLTLAMRARLLRHAVPALPDGAVAVEGELPSSFSDATDANGGTPAPGDARHDPPLVPHPLNPAQLVVVRPARPNCLSLRQPSMGGRVIPLPKASVPESFLHTTETMKVKV